LLLAFTVAAPLAATARADGVADFYKGKTITMLTGVGLGSSYGSHAHLFAAVFKAKVPGQPNVIVQAMTGAGGAKMVNYLYNVAPKDGTYIGFPLKYIAVNQAIGLPGVKYDAVKFNYLGSLGPMNSVVAIWTAGSKVRTIEEAQKQQVVMGSTGKSSETFITPTLMNNLLGTKFKVITGYAGTAAIHIAMERNEVSGVAASWDSVKAEKPQWLPEKKVVLLAQSGTARSADLPELPTLIDLARTPEQKEILTVVANGNAVGRLMMTPPGVPADRVAALRAAFEATVRDPGYLASIKARNLDFDPVAAAEVTRLIEDTLSKSPAVIAKVKAAMGAD
jgi:tripartite-type tricarboxylate transporter receptor subunit TctC